MIAIIPSRWGSTRFPGKPLALLAGRPMVVHVIEACRAANVFSEVVVATDDPRIAAAVSSHGARAELTSPHHPSGTDRVAEVAKRSGRPDSEPVLNVQGDEPLVHPESLRLLASAFDDAAVEMATLVRRLESREERASPNVVKAVLGLGGDALYFSRADLPVDRGAAEPPRWAHLGLYGYRLGTLRRLSRLPPSPLERAESLEQLRALEHGIRIRCVVTPHSSLGVDTPEDLARAEALLHRERAVPGCRTP